MLKIAALLTLLATQAAGTQTPRAPIAVDSVLASRRAVTLSFAIDSSNAGELRGPNVMLVVDKDQLSSPRIMLTLVSPLRVSRYHAAPQPVICRAVTGKYDCRDSTTAEVANGRLVITLRHSDILAWLFAEHPTAVWVYAEFANTRAGYLAVRYIDPPLLAPSKEALAQHDSVAASEGWGRGDE